MDYKIIQEIAKIVAFELKKEIDPLSSKVEQLIVQQENSNHGIVNMSSFQTKYNCDLPINSIDEFEKFNLNLLDKTVLEDLVSSLEVRLSII